MAKKWGLNSPVKKDPNLTKAEIKKNVFETFFPKVLRHKKASRLEGAIPFSQLDILSNN
jgi:hypothetical protein